MLKERIDLLNVKNNEPKHTVIPIEFKIDHDSVSSPQVLRNMEKFPYRENEDHVF